MKLLVQWATSHPQDWTEIDSQDWATLPQKPVPAGGEAIDDAPGWISNICVQGMCSGTVDHVAVEHLGDRVRVTTWCDDPDDYGPGRFRARVLTFHPLKPDPRLGGALNTHIESVIYAGPDDYEELVAQNFVDSELRPWSEFVPPPEEVTRHGIWLTDKLMAKHRKLARPVSWREWGEDGTVPPQRAQGLWAKARGTVTYYWRGGGTGDDAGSSCAPAVGTGNYKLIPTSTTVYDVSRDIPLATTDEISFAFTTEPGVPNDADWPTGDYRAQIDINGLEDSNVSAKVVILRVNSSCVIQETFGTSGSYTTVGTHLYTISSYNPSSGSATDRYQVRVLGTNTYAHQPRLLTLGVRSTDSYADGPWVGATVFSGTRDARSQGKVTDASDTRGARSRGKVTDAGDTRGARTAGTGAETPRYVGHTVESSTASRSDPTFEHTVPAGDNRYLIVVGFLHVLGNGWANPPTYNGETLTEIVASSPGKGAVWGIALGSSGSPTVADVVTDTDGANNCDYIVAVNYTGVDQTDATGDTSSHSIGNATATADITTVLADSLLLSFSRIWGDDGAPFTCDNNQQERWDGNTGGGDANIDDLSCQGCDLPATTTQQYQYSVTGSSADGHLLLGVELKKVFHGDDTREARSQGKVTDDADTREARSAAKVTDDADTREARAQGKVTDDSDIRAARTNGKVTDEGSTRGAATTGMDTKADRAGTVTYYMRGGGTGDDGNHACIPGTYGYKLLKDDAAQATITDTVPGEIADRICFSWTTESPEPPIPWPQGTYRAQVHVVDIGPDIVFRIQLLRIKVLDCTVLETLGTSGDLSGTGFHEFSVSGYDPGDSGRLQVRVICDNTNASSQNIRLNVRGTPSYADGPWYYTGDDTRDARSQGMVTDDADTRGARSAGKVTDAFSIRGARTEGVISGGTVFSGTRDARSAGKVTDGSDTRAGRSQGKITDGADTRDARSQGKVTDDTDTRGARSAGKVIDDADTRGARAQGKVTADASTRGGRSQGRVTGASSTRGARTLGIISGGIAHWGETCDVSTGGPIRGAWE